MAVKEAEKIEVLPADAPDAGKSVDDTNLKASDTPDN